MPQPRRLLVVTYDYPPGPSVGGTRWFTMKKYLERLGCEVTILTSNACGLLPTDDAEGVIRAPDLVASESLRRLLGRPPAPKPGGDVPVDRAPSALLTSVFVPDVYSVSWVPSAVRLIRRIVRERRIDAVITTSPKDSTHLVGLAARRSRAAWIADFRDGWIFESTRPPLPTRAQRALDAKLEARVVVKADAVVAFSDILVADFEDRFQREVFCVTNGWDPELIQAADVSVVEPPRPGTVTLVYTGTLTGAVGAPTDRTPVPLLEALESLAERDGDLATRIELVVVGRLTDRDEAILARFAHLGAIRHMGYVPRSTSLAVQQAADVLVLVTGTTPSSIPMKLFEYLGAGRPILHLGRGGAADAILRETGAGVTVSPHDREAMVEQLRRIADSQFMPAFSPPNIDRFSYPYVAERMAEVIEYAIARRASSRRSG